jgi:hypothetical protein
MPEAGWYEDPLQPGGQRYWDGQAWSQSTQPPSAQFTLGDDGPPPFNPIPVLGEAPSSWTTERRTPSGLLAIGDWIGQSFKGLLPNLHHLLLVYVVVPLVTGLALYFVARSLLGGLVVGFDADEDQFADDLLGRVVPLVAVWLAAFLAGSATQLAGGHLLYEVHRSPLEGGRPSGIRSLRAGVARLPRFFGVYLLIVGVATVVSVGLALGSALVGDVVPGLAPVLIVVAFLALFVLMIYFTVKLAFLLITVAVVPRGTSSLKASWRASHNRFWPIVGRLLLGTLLAYLVAIPFAVLGQLLFLPILGQWIEFDALDSAGGAGGRVLLNGRDLSDIGSVELVELLPSPSVAAMIIAATVLIYGPLLALTTSFTASLYVDAEANPS